MDQLRQSILDNLKYTISLTPQESARGDWEIENLTWLPEHRLGAWSWSHPESKNFPKGRAFVYQLYSSPENCQFPEHHWATQKIYDDYIPAFWGYNPTFDILDQAIPEKIHMYLPIYQRYLTCKLNAITGEIFNNLCPQYGKN